MAGNANYIVMDGWLETLLGLILGSILMYWIYSYYRKLKGRERIERQSTVLLERIKSVCQLITIEGEFAEIYNYESKRDRFMSLISSRKRALIVINAKARIGYDLKKIILDSDPDTKRIILKNFPQPEILSVEPDLEFYDIKNGLFNRFTPKDLTAVNKEAKDVIMEKIPQSGIMETARREALEAVLLIEKLVETIGWKLDYSSLELSEEDKQIAKKLKEQP